MIYLDNSATTFYKPPEVISSVTNALRFISANPGRGGHSMAQKAAKLVYKTRENTARFIDAPNPERVIFTGGCTAALNAAIFGTVKPGGHVITSAYEHNSVLRPLFELEKRGLITVTVLYPENNGAITEQQVENAIKPNTYLAAITHVSNVTGTVNPIKSIGRMLKKKDVIFLVDGAQSVGYGSVSMKDDNIDILCFAPHKGLHSMQGLGILAFCDRIKIRPLIYGGTGTMSESVYQPLEYPESLESGTLNTPAIAALNAALSFSIENTVNMRERISAIGSYLLEQLVKMDRVTVYTPKNTINGIAAFNIDHLTSADVSGILSEQYDICVRGGLHCAPLIHKHLGTMEIGGIVRASVGIDTTFHDIKFFINAIKEISS